MPIEIASTMPRMAIAKLAGSTWCTRSRESSGTVIPGKPLGTSPTTRTARGPSSHPSTCAATAVTMIAIIAPGIRREIRAQPRTIIHVNTAIASARGSVLRRWESRFSIDWIKRGDDSTDTPSTLWIWSVKIRVAAPSVNPTRTACDT